MRVVVCGVGAVGSRAARQLASSPEVSSLVVSDRNADQAAAVAESLGAVASAEPWHPDVVPGADALLVAAPIGPARVLGGVHLEVIETALAAGIAVISVADTVAEVEALLRLDGVARAGGAPLVIGAGMAPGLSDVLARHAAGRVEAVEEVHVAHAGTGGPACARQHHHALGDEAVDWRDGQWSQRSGGSGRELCWFPDPVGGQDCYRAGLADALLLVPAFPGVQRVTARMAATRRDRLTAALPMLRRPHPEGAIGAVRVAVRGKRAGAMETIVLGAIDRPGVMAGAVAAVATLWAVEGRLGPARAGGLAELVTDPGAFLAELSRRGVKAAVFEGNR